MYVRNLMSAMLKNYKKKELSLESSFSIHFLL